jgi:hypothetical protein
MPVVALQVKEIKRQWIEARVAQIAAGVKMRVYGAFCLLALACGAFAYLLTMRENVATPFVISDLTFPYFVAYLALLTAPALLWLTSFADAVAARSKLQLIGEELSKGA